MSYKQDYWIKYREEKGLFTVKECAQCGAEFRLDIGQSRRTWCSSCLPVLCSSCGVVTKRVSSGLCRTCYTKQYYALNADVLKLKSALYRVEHPGKIVSSSARYRAGSRSIILERGKEWRTRLRLDTVAKYGGKCECCGETEPKFLCIDHPNGDGKVDRSNGYGGTRLYARLRREGWPSDGYRLLCYNCNNALRLVGVCPHQLGREVR